MGKKSKPKHNYEIIVHLESPSYLISKQAPSRGRSSTYYLPHRYLLANQIPVTRFIDNMQTKHPLDIID